MREYSRDITVAEIRDCIGPIDQPILEVGAWEGDTTYEMLRAMPNALIVAMEPDPRPLKRLRDRFEGREGGVVIVPAAAGAVNGIVPWYASHGDVGGSKHCRDHDWDLSSSLRRPTHHLARAPQITFDRLEVRCVRVDDMSEEFPETRFPLFYELAFIDAQGAQRDIIEGGQCTLDDTRFIYVECHNTPEYDGEVTAAELHALLPMHRPIAKYSENFLYERIRS